jgi:hypothetical protein
MFLRTRIIAVVGADLALPVGDEELAVPRACGIGGVALPPVS